MRIPAVVARRQRGGDCYPAGLTYSHLPWATLRLIALFVFATLTAVGQYELIKIDAEPAKGFEWPYYIVLPDQIKTPAFLTVMPNNTGVSDDPEVHNVAAKQDLWFYRFTAGVLGSPMMTPTFPRSAQLYTHALDRATLLSDAPKLRRIDLQLIAMIEDAKGRLRERGVPVQDKVWMFGMSAGGSFASRFAMLHPEVLQAALIGAPGWGPIMPVAEWNGCRLPYPEGIADLEELTGKPFDIEAYRQIGLEFWVGDLDRNTNPWWDPLNDPEVALVEEAFNGGPELLWRWPQYEAIYRNQDIRARWLVYPEVGHFMSTAWILDMFERNRQSPPPKPPPKPLYPNFHFLNLQSSAGSEVRIVLMNTAATAAQVEILGLDGTGAIREKLALELPAESRKEMVVAEAFAESRLISSLLLQSDSGFLAGYSQITLAGRTFLFPGATGSTEGTLTKPGTGRITAAYLLNVSTAKASVRFTAMDESGNELAATSFDLPPRARFGGTLATLFGTDLPPAVSFKFTSTAKLAGFILGSSAETGTLQMLTAQPLYWR